MVKKHDNNNHNKNATSKTVCSYLYYCVDMVVGKMHTMCMPVKMINYPFLKYLLYWSEQWTKRRNTSEVPLLEGKLLPSRTSSVESSTADSPSFR
jgi:hypothetical protein